MRLISSKSLVNPHFFSAEISTALSRWEKQVTTDEIAFTTEPNKGVTKALITYTILRSHQEGNMVYLFTQSETGG